MSASPPLQNGSGAAAILAAGIGGSALGIFTVAGDKVPAVRSLFTWYVPTGPLSGVTTMTVLVWLAVWALLAWRWKARFVRLGRVNMLAFALLAVGILLTFPPVIDLF
ncbi:MAG TPA: hypothetical protein VHZ73_01315 [Vicinamibacterales bacterium]|jgi:hypothetical protein|nr:hypothetical protein [Vicinamibacterales bacterium]